MREIARRLGQTAALIETTVVDPSEAIEERARQRALAGRILPATKHVGRPDLPRGGRQPPAGLDDELGIVPCSMMTLDES